MSRVKKFKKPSSKLVVGEKKHKWRLTKEVGWSIFIGGIMILSVLGAFMGDDTDSGTTMKYGKFKFTIENNQYALKIDGKTSLFTFFPAEVEDVAIPKEAYDAVKNTPQLIMTFKPQREDMSGIDLARFDMATALFDQGKGVVQGVAGADLRYALPYLTCDNATQFVPVIYFETTNNTADTVGIVFKDNCIIFSGRSQLDFVKLKDRFIYSIYGVIQ